MSTGESTTEAHWARVTDLVDAALKYPDPAKRSRFLGDACDGDDDLRHEVEQLLRFEDAECDVLDAPPGSRDALEAVASILERSPADRRPVPGQQLGPYRIERVLGEGGMGVVLLAHEPELDRFVALKLLHRQRLTPEMLARFESERRILARLDHPGIARIFGGGTLEELPYFTLEVVDGEPIDAYCDHHRLNVEQRLELILKVCDALSCAHRNLVIHRDLKPSNLLVTAEGQPKLLDFGIAKELTADGPFASLAPAGFTRTGRQPFTPAYASPEQVRGQGMSTAVDVYALGVLLYRLLCGHPPYELDADVLENCRRICEQEPPPPSRRVTPPAAEDRSSEPRRLRRRLEGDLDSIVAKALVKASGDRYASIDELAADLRRHLDGQPVAARRDTWRYRTGKFLHRHRWRLAAALLLLTLGTIGWAARERNAQRLANLAEQQQLATAQAQTAEEQADVLTGFLRSLLRSTHPDERRGQPLTAAEILRRGESRARRDLGDRPEMLAHQIEAIGLAHQMLGHPEDARPLLEESLALRRRVYAGDHTLIARGLNNLAALVHLQGENHRAEKLYRLALAMRQRLGPEPGGLTRIESNLALLALERGDLAEAEDRYRRLLDTRREAFGDNDRDVTNSLRSLGTVLYLRGDFEGAEPLLRQAVERRRLERDVRPTRIASALASLGRVLLRQKRYDEAEEALTEALDLRRQVLGDDHLHVALARKDLATLFFELGETATARVFWHRAQIVLRAEQPDGWELADAESQLGERLLAQGRRAEAEICLRESYETLRRLRGELSLYTVEAHRRLSITDRDS